MKIKQLMQSVLFLALFTLSITLGNTLISTINPQLAVAESTAKAPAASPKEGLKVTLDQLIETVNKYPGDANKNVRREKLREIIAPKFDFDEMARRSLGTHWRERTEDEQKEFTELFSELLATTYLARIEEVEEDIISIDGEKVVPPKALVKTSVTYNGDVFPMHYKLLSRGGEWKVYDVVIENIGLVSNYRNEFAGIIRKEQFSGLIAALKKKTEKAQAKA